MLVAKQSECVDVLIILRITMLSTDIMSYLKISLQVVYIRYIDGDVNIFLRSKVGIGHMVKTTFLKVLENHLIWWVEAYKRLWLRFFKTEANFYGFSDK